MITTIKDDENYVVAFCEWRLVGPSGYEVQNGEYIWVNDLWVHPKYRELGLIGRIIDEVMSKVPQAKYCYFQRLQVNERVRIYPRKVWERRRCALDPIVLKEI